MKNVKLLNETMDRIKANPQTHDQGVWAHFEEETCETFMCSAGHNYTYDALAREWVFYPESE